MLNNVHFAKLIFIFMIHTSGDEYSAVSKKAFSYIYNAYKIHRYGISLNGHSHFKSQTIGHKGRRVATKPHRPTLNYNTEK